MLLLVLSLAILRVMAIIALEMPFKADVCQAQDVDTCCSNCSCGGLVSCFLFGYLEPFLDNQRLRDPTDPRKESYSEKRLSPKMRMYSVSRASYASMLLG